MRPEAETVAPAFIVTGTISIDLTSVREDRQRNRVFAALAAAPVGAAVEVLVGPLIVNSDAARELRLLAQQRRLLVNVKGETYAVQRWVSALRTGELCGVLL